jgi:2-epi-5-epi-valiolone synthase
MLKKIKDGNDVSFIMGMNYESKVKIDFRSSIDFIENYNTNNKLIFIDPIVLANQPAFLDLESRDQNVTLVPTNIHETSKNLDSTIAILKIMEDKGIGRRNELVCAVGGGALMDEVSFAASIFRRGIFVTKIPTTLLGIVDASIGIKTGVNFEGQRNRLGSYHFDFDVIIDHCLLNGLGKGMIRQGLGEIFKIAVIKGETLFEKLLLNIDELENVSFYQGDKGVDIMMDSIELMLEELHSNPRENNLKRCVDFGHSFCPLVEMESLKRKNFKSVPHGYAVAYDCVLTATISLNRQKIASEQYSKIMELYRKFDFDFGNEIYRDNNLLWASFLELTKHRGYEQNLPIPIEIGKYDFVQDLTFEEMIQANISLHQEQLK